MKNSFKRATALLLSIVFCIGALSAAVLPAVAEEAEDLVKGEFVYAPHTYTEGDLTDIYYYSDSFFSSSALNYNEHLATMSMILASASISSQDADATYETKSRNLENLLKKLDFTNFQVNEYYKQKPAEQTMGVGIASKLIEDGDKTYTLLAIVPRSAGYEKEWAGNFTVGKDGVHQGFATGRDIILEFAKKYVETYGKDFEDEVKVWTVGYSRGAGVANLLAAYLDDNPTALGVDVTKENIFAYTFGTPANVQFADVDADEATALSKKLQLEKDYANIHNRFSEYDIITYVPFKDWNFGFYGTTKLFDVNNAQKKAQMLSYLEKTNKTIYDVYTAQNSTADPDNFMAVMLEVGADGSIGFVPADASYGIPNNQKDFLDQRVSFLVENLVPDREVYVDAGYEYALQCVMSLYFGLDAKQSALLLGGMSHNLPFVAASYYAFFLADFYLETEQGLATVAALIESLPVLEGYVAALASDPTVNTTDWYVYASTFIASPEYAQLKAVLQSIGSNVETLRANVAYIQQTFESLAVSMTTTVLAEGVAALEINEEEKSELFGTVTSTEVTGPLTHFLVYLLLGDDDVSELDAFDPSNKSIALAATFYANAGRYMRTHNNEIILSWLRTEDSYYANETWHVHEHRVSFDAGGHWGECDCGDKQAVEAHSFGEWRETGVTEDGNKTVVRYCYCGYEENAVLSSDGDGHKLNVSPTTVVVICIGVVAIVGAAVIMVIVSRKRRAVK